MSCNSRTIQQLHVAAVATGAAEQPQKQQHHHHKQHTTHARGLRLFRALDVFLLYGVHARAVPRRGAKNISKGLHGTGHGFHGIRPNFTRLVRAGTVLGKKTGRHRDRERFHGITLDGNESFKMPRHHGIIP